MTNLLRSAFLLAGGLCLLQAQNPAMNGNMAWQMQQQQMQAQQMFQMQQQMQRTMQRQQMQMQQQQQANQQMAQMAAQANAQRLKREALAESTARKQAGSPSSLLERPSREAWKLGLDASKSFPAFDGVRLAYCVNGGRILQVLEAATGKVLCEATFQKPPVLEPLFIGEDLVYGTPERELVVLDPASGKEKHRLALDALGSFFLSEKSAHPKILYPAQEGKTLVVATYGKEPSSPLGGATGWIYAIDPSSWTIRWKQAFEGGPDMTPQIQGNRVLAGGAGRIVAYDLATGKQLWESRVARSAEIKDGPLLGERLAFACDGKLVSVDLADGKVSWTLPYKGWFMPMGEGERILLVEERGWVILDQWLVAVDAATGKKVWEQNLGATRLPWIQNGKVFCNGRGTLWALDLSTGKQLWSHPFGAAPAMPIVVSGEGLYAVHREGEGSCLSALRLKDGTTAWEYAYSQRPEDGLLFFTPEGFLAFGRQPELLFLR
ncbi:PQQ-binding-like beta-propeller repeat protein [Geothrix sp. 21YS21S-4]|uniref:PQQ-binding-like beta-propeller repeat protein n=1 Tax=Geothrix sp. 21YS21S-4 TaxID=3068889 RepID=UPI0027B9A80F|nr:PQQ-binding-like beta-propeller repeat protein [Geothrix sp. 21YS21S-4]